MPKVKERPVYWADLWHFIEWRCEVTHWQQKSLYPFTRRTCKVLEVWSVKSSCKADLRKCRHADAHQLGLGPAEQTTNCLHQGGFSHSYVFFSLSVRLSSISSMPSTCFATSSRLRARRCALPYWCSSFTFLRCCLCCCLRSFKARLASV